MTAFTILLAGLIEPTGRLRAQVAGTRCIAADAGIEHAATLGIEPELWVGDFDSARAPERFDHVAREEWPSAKDVSDGALAIERAVERGATRLVVVGPFGGRTDHSTLHLLAAFGWPPSLLTDGREEAMPLIDAHPDWPAGTIFSVLAFDPVTVTLSGCRWPLDAVPVEPGSTLTLSNEVRGSLHARATGGRALLLGQL